MPLQTAGQFGAKLKLRIKNSRQLFPVLMRLYQMAGKNLSLHLPTRDTHLLMDGYFRCANTYLERVITQLNPDKKFAWHNHAPASVRNAIAWRVPTVILTRDPVDAVASRLIMHPQVPDNIALLEYVWYYQRIAHCRDEQRGFMVAHFSDVTSNVLGVIDRINSRFELNLEKSTGDASADREIFGESKDKRGHWAKTLGAEGTPYPNKERDAMKEQARQRVLAAAMAPLLEQARAEYERFTAWAVEDAKI